MPLLSLLICLKPKIILYAPTIVAQCSFRNKILIAN